MFEEITKELQELHDKKNQDYSGGDNNYKNFRQNSMVWGTPAYTEPLKRLQEKVIRIAQLQGREANNESIEDSIKDIATLAIIALTIYRTDNGN